MHELEFCAEVKSFCDELFGSRQEWPFGEAKIEQYGTGNYRRSDLRIFLKGSKTPFLCGEVKLPGTPEGRSPYDASLVQDSFEKADNVQCPYFFTWNVNCFVLFDRSKWNVPIINRRLRDWNSGLNLKSPADCQRPEVLSHLKTKFLPELFAFLAEIHADDKKDWGMSPDLIFIRSLESHLDWPVNGTCDYMLEKCKSDSSFSSNLQSWMANDMSWTFDPSDQNIWYNTVERAARTLSYVFCNRVIFYEAIRAKYPENLRALEMPGSRHGHEGIYQYFRSEFHRAVLESGDYEPIFYPDVDDRMGSLIFASEISRQGWKGVFANIAQYNFREIPYDIIGGIFQKLIAPEERQKFGQFFTNEDIVDIINSFCINRAADTVIDPACGSGSFLIRAYHRKAWLSERHHKRQRSIDSHLRHDELLRQIYGCDIALFATHLATLNLAARQISEKENYPLIARGNFFEVIEKRDEFCRIPQRIPDSDGVRRSVPVPLPELDAIVGNPPYIRQEAIQKRGELKKRSDETKESFESRCKNTKDHFHELCSEMWPDLKLSGRSDLHCYFWPVAASCLKEKGYFGFLTSSSWLDVEYGFALQRWILKNFKIIAIMESLDEPWFPDARVKTAITILQRCSDLAERSSNFVRFVRFLKPVRQILGEDRCSEESERQAATEKLRDSIMSSNTPAKDEFISIDSAENYRIITVSQTDLWKEGVRAWELLKQSDLDDPMPEDENSNDEESSSEKPSKFMLSENHASYSDYAAGKWGRFLRAPDIYFKLIREYDSKFVRLGEIAEIRRGITSGCDAFFMPHDVTNEVLEKIKKGLLWRNLPLMTPCKLKDVESGKNIIIKAGDNTLHPIEKEFIRPEVHSLMQVDRPVVRISDCTRVVLWVKQELEEISRTFAAKYIRWGARQTFASKKSKSVPVPKRSSCASRQRWYDLTNLTRGYAFWPHTQKYRHIVPYNPESLLCNCSLYYIAPKGETCEYNAVIPAILNSTIISLMKHFYGRYVGSEGTLGTMIIDCLLIDVPDPRNANPMVVKKLLDIFKKMQDREIGPLVSKSMMNCHSHEYLREILKNPLELPEELQQEDRQMLDDTIFELIGINSPNERKNLLEELYRETTEYYRYQRTQDIQSMENRSAVGKNHITPQDLSASVWDSLSDEEKGKPIAKWIKKRWPELISVKIPDGKASMLGADDMFEPGSVKFRQGEKKIHSSYSSPEQAELVVKLSELEIRGEVSIPKNSEVCAICLKELKSLLNKANSRFKELADSRTGQEQMREKIVFILMNWFVHGRQ